MKKTKSNLLLLSASILAAFFLISSSHASDDIYEIIYDEISRRGGEPGGSSFEEVLAPVKVDAVKVEALSGVIELEYIELEVRDEYGPRKVDFIELLQMDIGNEDAFGIEGFINANLNNSYAHPKEITLYLNQSLSITKVNIGLESYSSGASVRLSLIQKGFSPPPPSEEPRNPGPIPPTEPPPPPPPTCDLYEVNEEIRFCQEDIISLQRDLPGLRETEDNLRREVDRRASEVLVCEDERSVQHSRLDELHYEINQLPKESNRLRQKIRQTKVEIENIKNPPQIYECFVQKRKYGRDRYVETGPNRAQLLQKLVRKCIVTGEHACGKGWDPNDQNRWGCRAIRQGR